MKKYIIEGGQPLNGEVRISGSKNSALPIMAATLLCDEPITLHNVPKLRDIYTMINLLEKLGKKVIHESSHTLQILPYKNDCFEANYEIVKQMRASITVLGPVLAKQKKALISFPGGCVFGPRPIDIHLNGLRALGAVIDIHHGYIEAKTDKLIGGTVNLMGEFGTSVLATDNILMAAVLAEGKTIIENVAQEPETQDLILFLKKMGAQIETNNHVSIEVNGIDKLHGCEYTIIPDRIEAGTFIVFSALTGGALDVHYSCNEHLSAVFKLCEEIGIPINTNPSGFQGFSLKPIKVKDLNNFKLTTLPYPYFPTDLQPVFAALAVLVPGHTTIIEKVFINRFSYVPELVRMGAEIKIDNGFIIIKGVDKLEGAVVQASDLRATAALIAVGLAAEGYTEVRRIYHGERGYEDLPGKINNLGGKIKIESDKIL